MHACPYQSLENRELTALIDEVPKMEASVLLSRRIEEGDPDSPTLRDYVLARFEMLLCLNLTKTALETLMQQDNRERGGKTLIPTTLGQFTLFLHGEIRFYPVCCVACDASEHSCPMCKAGLFVAENSKRPKRIMFVRSVKAFVTDLFRVPNLAEAVRSMQKRVQRTGVIADVWDGKIVKELVAGGARKPHTALTRLTHTPTGLLRPGKDLVFMGSWDGFRPFKDVSRKSMDVATLALLNLPPPLRFRPELMFVWWGISGHYSDINPFLRVALQDFIESFQQDFLNEESTYTHTEGNCLTELWSQSIAYFLSLRHATVLHSARPPESAAPGRSLAARSAMRLRGETLKSTPE